VTSDPIRIIHVTFTQDGHFQLQFTSDPGSYVIEATSDFLQWDVVTTVINSQGQAMATDPEPKRTHRYYRIRPDVN
jgi:hypothetical protein